MIDLNSPIEKLELSKRAYNGLHFDNIETVGQLVALTRADLLRIPRIGKWCLEEIEEVLACHGFKIKPYGEARPVGKPRGKWRPIETAPKDGREILTYGRDEEGEEYFWVSGWWPFPTHEEGHWTCWHISDWATHWMPLPEPPK